MVAIARAGVDVGLPARRAFGLFSVTPPVDNDRAAAAGHEYQAMCSETSLSFDPCESPSESPGSPPEPATIGPETFTGDPVFVEARYRCGLVGDNSRQASDRAEAILDLTYERQVETALWGQLTDPEAACVAIDPACPDVCFALGAVEAWLRANLPGQGVIHAPTILEPLIADGNMLVRNGPRLETPLGTPIVLGSGYSTNVDNPNDATIFGTGPVHVYVGESQTIETIDHEHNSREVLARRATSVSFECGCVSALVTVCETES